MIFEVQYIWLQFQSWFLPSLSDIFTVDISGAGTGQMPVIKSQHLKEGSIIRYNNSNVDSLYTGRVFSGQVIISASSHFFSKEL